MNACGNRIRKNHREDVRKRDEPDARDRGAGACRRPDPRPLKGDFGGRRTGSAAITPHINLRPIPVLRASPPAVRPSCRPAPRLTCPQKLGFTTSVSHPAICATRASRTKPRHRLSWQRIPNPSDRKRRKAASSRSMYRHLLAKSAAAGR